MEIEYMSQRVGLILWVVVGDAIQLLGRELVQYKHWKPNEHSLTPIMI